MKFTLAELALQTHKALPQLPERAVLAKHLSGTAGAQEENLPAKRYGLEQSFKLAVEQARLLPEADIFEGLAAITMRLPKLWVETVRPGSNLRTGCLFTQNAEGIGIMLVMENSVKDWEAVGWPVPKDAYKMAGRALYGNYMHMRFGETGVEWLSGDLNCSTLPMAKVVSHIERNPKFAQPDLRAQTIGDIRKHYTAADWMARALLLMHSPLLVDPAVFEETPAMREERRQEGARLRQGLRGKDSLRAPCGYVRHDVAAVGKVAAARTAAGVSALIKVVTLQVGQSKELQCSKTGAYLLDKNGNRRRNKGYKRNQKVSEAYFEKQTMLAASRPVALIIEGGAPVLTVKPK